MPQRKKDTQDDKFNLVNLGNFVKTMVRTIKIKIRNNNLIQVIMKTKNIFNRKENPDISKRSGFSNIFRWKILMVLACLFFGLSGVSARVITITKGNNAEISTTSIEIGSGSCGSFDVTFAQHQNYTELTLDVAQADFSGFTSTGYASNYQINAYSAENNTKQKVQVNNGNSGAMTTIWIKVDSDNKVSIHPTNTCISSTPTINITCPSPTSFSTTAGTVGSNQSFTVTGSNLTDNVSITTNRQDLFELSANGGSTWNSTVTLTQSGGSVTGTNNVQIRLKSGLNALSSTSVTLTVSSTGATSQTCSLTATVTAPSASITRTCPASSAFSTTTNAASASQSFTVSGSNLTNDLIVSTNNTNLFEVSKDNSAWSNSVSYTPSGGSVSTTTVYVRLKNGLSVQSNTSVTLTVSSTNATSQTCSLTATVTSSGGSNITVASTGSTATSVDCGGRNVWKLSRTGSSNITIDITNAGIANTGAWKLTSSFSGDFGTDKVNNVSHPGGDIYIEIITSTSPKEVIINSEPGCSGCTSTAPSLDFSSLCVGEVRTLPTGDGGTWSIKSGALLTVSGNAGNQSVTANAVGSAALIYTKAGCTASSDVNITVNPNPSQPVIQEKTFVCGTNIENFLQNYQNMKLYSGSCKNGTPLTAGSFTSNTNYYVTQTDANGCESSCIELEVSVEQFKPVFKRNTKTVEPGTKVSILNELVNNKVDGATIKWYKGTNCTGTLIDDPANTILENGATYYATQTVSGCEVSACSDGAITVTVNPVCESNYSIKIWGTQVTINGVQRESSESTRPVVSLCAIRDCPEIYEFTLTSSGDDSNFSIYTGDSNNEQNRVIFYSGNETTHEGTRPTINANGKPIGLSYNRCGDAEALPGNPAGEDSNVGCLIYTPSSVTNTKNYFLVVDGNNRYVTDDTTNISCSDCPPFEGTNTTQLCMGVEKQLSPATGWTLVSGNATLNTETGIVITDANAAGGNTISLQHCSGESLNLTVYSMPTIDENGHPSTAEIPAKCKNSETFGELTLAFASGASTNRSYQWYIISGSAIPGNPGTGGTPIANATSQNYTPDISQLAVGTYYFYCVIKNNQNANANVCEVTSNISAAHTVTDCNTPDPGIECPALAISICQGINPGSISSINPCGNYCVFSFIVASYNTPGLEIREGGSRITSETWSIDNLSNLTFGYATRCGFLNVTTTDDAILGQSNVTVYAKIETSPTKKITFSLEPFCVCPNEPTINHNASSGTASPTVCITDGTLEDIVYDLTYAAGATIKFTDKSNQATVSESSIGLSFNANASTATIIQIGALVAGEYEYVITTTQEDEACPSATAKGTITINAAITAGSIQTNTITVCENETVTFSNLTSPSGGTGRYTYTWEYNDGEGWKPVSNPVNIQGYNSLPLTKTTDFRRLVNDDLCTGAAVPTEAITITVNPALAPGSIIPASQTVCHNAMATINTEVPTELVLSTQENITYQWQRKVGEVWTDIVGATNGATFTSDALTTTMQFRRKAAYSSTGTCAVYTDPVTVTVIPQLVAGMISAPEAICEEENATFTSTATASGGTGSYQYQWQSKTGAGAWTSLGEWNSEATTYIATSLNSTTSFRRSVRNSDGTCDTVCSNVITISVYQTPVAGTITAAGVKQ